MKLIRLFLLFIMLSVPALAAPLKIAATVGDEAITTYDMVNRAKLIMYSTGMQSDQETFRKIMPQALQGLISDKLVVQEATRLGIQITDKEMAEAKQSIEQKNKLEAGQMDKMLEANGILPATLDNQVKAQIYLSKIKGSVVRQQFSISDSEVEDFVKAQSFNQRMDEYLLNEIVLPIEVPEDDAKVKELADKLYAELNAGKDFAAIAREFSGAASAFNDGVVGWLPENQVPKEILAELKKNKIGEVSKPIKSIEGYFIVKATQKRELNSIAEEDEINLKHYSIPYPENATPEKVKSVLDSLAKIKYSDDACNAPDDFSLKYAMSSKDYGSLKIADLDPKIRPLVAELPIGEFSKPLKTPDSGLVFLVCERIENIAPLIDDNKRDEARNALFVRKLDLQTRKYLRDLRRKTNIEIRL